MISIFYDLNKVFKALGSLVPKLLHIRVICVIDSMPLITTSSFESSQLCIFYFQQISGKLPLSDEFLNHYWLFLFFKLFETSTVLAH